MKAQRATGYLLIAVLTVAGWGRSASGWFWNIGTPATPHPAVARVIALDTRGASLGTGTLVAVNEYHGLVVTNWHVVRDARGSILVQFPDGFASPATVLKVDREWDLAALAIWRPRARPVPIAVEPPKPGDVLMIAGYGQGDYRISYGPCTQYLSPSPGLPAELVELRATARQGDSGGPIFNGRGELAGVLFGSGFGETMGAYCGRVRSFLFPLKEVFDKLPPPDPLLLAANSVGPPGRTAANGLTTPQGQGLIPAQPASPVGSPPVTLPLTASNNTPERVEVNTSQGTGTNGASPTSWPGSSLSQSSLPSKNSERSWTDTGTREDAASDVSAWRPAETVTDSHSRTDLAAGGYSSSKTPGESASSGLGSVAGSSNSPRSSTGYSDDSKTNAGFGDGYARAQRGKDALDNSSNYYGLSAFQKSDETNSNSWPDYERRSTCNDAGNSGDLYAKDDDSGAYSPGKWDALSSAGTGKDTAQQQVESGRRPYEAWNNWSNGPYESSEEPYADRRSVTEWGDSGKNSSSSGNRYAQDSREERRSRATTTASINTHSRGIDSSSQSADTASGKGARDSYRQDQLTDSLTEKPSEDLSRTIKSREETKKYSDSGSNWDYSPIPVYDANSDSEESQAFGDGSKFGSLNWSREGNTGAGTSEKYSEFAGSQSGSFTGTSGGGDNMKKRTGVSSSRNSASSGDATYRNSEYYRDGTKEYSSTSGTYSAGKNDTSWSDGENHAENKITGRNSIIGSTQSGSENSRTTPASERSSATVAKGVEQKNSDQANKLASSTRFSNGDESTSSRQSGSPETNGDSNIISGANPTTDAKATSEQPSAGTNKLNVGWETMIGILGLLVLFVQSMRWLSLLYDRSYYRRRSYRTTRRRTTWPPPPPSGYRWYY